MVKETTKCGIGIKVREVVAEVLGVEVSDIISKSPDCPLHKLGFDEESVAELEKKLKAAFGFSTGFLDGDIVQESNITGMVKLIETKITMRH